MNPYTSKEADVILDPVGIVFANSLLGEITPAIAAAMGSSKAYKILIPTNRCNHYIVGCSEGSLSQYLLLAVEKPGELLG